MGRTTKPAATAAQSRKTALRSLERGGGCCEQKLCLPRRAQIRFQRQVASAVRFHRHTMRRNYTGRMTRCRLDDGIARYLVSRASRRRERRRAWYRYGAGYHRGATSATRGVAFREGEATMTNGSAEVNDRLMSAYRRHRQYHRLIVPVPISLQHPASPLIDVMLVCSPFGRRNGYQVFISPHYFYPTDTGCRHNPPPGRPERQGNW
jgi:hypothetical protein